MRSKFVQVVLIAVVIFLFLKLGIRPPIPGSLITLFMAITALTLFIYVSSDEESWQDFIRPILATLVEEKRARLRLIVFIVFPLLVGWGTLKVMMPGVDPPAELRVIHPAPPSNIQFRGKNIKIEGLVNPLRENGEEASGYIKEGMEIYFKNCFFCHGDALDGNGHFTLALNPPPADFTDTGTIAQLQESYLFWRIAKGGIGLPRQSKPWNSAMPAWEENLTEDAIWKTIMYLYHAAGVSPRTWE